MVASGLDPSGQFLRRVKNRPPLRRRSRVRAWLRLVAVLAGIALGGIGAWAAFRAALSTELLAFDDLAVEGAPDELAEEVTRSMQAFRGHNLLALDLASVRRRIEAIPRVRRASLRRRLPHGLEIEIEPREPRAVVESTGAAYLVDEEAVVLGSARESRDDLPRIRVTGASGSGSSPSSEAAPSPSPGVSVALDVLAWLERSGYDLGAELDGLRVEGRGVVLELENRLEILIGDADALPGKFEAFEALLESDPPTPPAVVDVRFRDMVVVNGPER